MGLRFRQSFKLFPGVRLNLGRTGVSASFGVPGATLNVGPRGIHSNIGIPGTGLSYRSRHKVAPKAGKPALGQPANDAQPGPAYWQAPGMREIGSASVEQLTSESLLELRDMIADARRQRNEIDADLEEAKARLESQSNELERRRRSLFRYFYKRRIAELESDVPETRAEIERLSAWLEATQVEIHFETKDAAKKAYASLVRAFELLRTSERIWDITSDRGTQRVIERTAASRMLTRDPVRIDFSTSDLVKFEGRPMRFPNVNGEDMMIYPGVAIMPRADGAFALIDLRDIRLQHEAVRFIEEDELPSDCEVVDRTWAKTNKDGSPDLRFKMNYAIPVCNYGRFVFSSTAGIEEEYQFSNADAAARFAMAFQAYQRSLSAD